MRPERYRQVKEIFTAAVECNTGERADFLNRACAEDAELRVEVESLLAHDEPAADFIEESAFDVAARMLAEGDMQPPAGGRIGPYRVEREIGRGGLGVVFLAERDDEQFRKLVAVKLIKRGMDTDAVVHRFRNERQILAELEHPFIARLLDGGATADGLPYLVMEYVEGQPVLNYCDQHGLTTSERLRLFRSICAAVSYAHQHLVVHRDLKPSNILITEDGTPKLLDFGIAKVLDPKQSDLTRDQTRADLRVLTPEYASPEQVRGERITTATDIYSLGVILYELLTGQRPYKLKDKSPAEMLRIICDTEPTKPSQTVAESGWKTSDSGDNPHSAFRNPKSLRGDLDNIVLMALRKDPARRYKSVEQFSEDIRRYLEGLPIIARKDTFTYRAVKFIGRNRLGVAAATLIILAIIVGLIGMTWEAHRAQAQQVRAERISEFLANALSYSDPTAAMPGSNNRRDATINQMLDDVAPRIEKELADQPEVRAALERTVGEAYAAQNRLADAEHYLRAALQTQLEIFGSDHVETARTLLSLAGLQYLKGDAAGSEENARRVLAVYRQQGKEADARSFAKTLCFLGDLVWEKGEMENAEALYQEALSISAGFQGADREFVAAADIGLGGVRWALGRLDEAIALFRAAVAEYRALPHLRWRLGSGLTELGSVLTHKKEFTEALANLREGEAIIRETFGEPSFPLADNLYRQAYALCLKGDYAAAEQTLNKSEEMFRQNFPGMKMSFANLYDARGMILTRTGRTAAGERYNRQALEMYQSLMQRGANGITLSRIHLAESLAAQKKYAEAEEVLLAAYKDSSEVRGKGHFRTRDVARELVKLYEAWQKPDRAAQYRALS